MNFRAATKSTAGKEVKSYYISSGKGEPFRPTSLVLKQWQYSSSKHFLIPIFVLRLLEVSDDGNEKVYKNPGRFLKNE